MLTSKDNSGRKIGFRETYFSKDESVDVSVHRDVTTITTRDRTTGKVSRDSKQRYATEERVVGSFSALVSGRPRCRACTFFGRTPSLTPSEMKAEEVNRFPDGRGRSDPPLRATLAGLCGPGERTNRVYRRLKSLPEHPAAVF